MTTPTNEQIAVQLAEHKTSRIVKWLHSRDVFPCMRQWAMDRGLIPVPRVRPDDDEEESDL
jgi:hypothetical protein